MPGTETLVWILTGAFFLISVLGGTVWVLIREETREHAALLKQKADSEDLTKIEDRWRSELASVKEGNEKLIDKLEAKHTREIDALATRFGEALRTTETNILNQIKLMVEVLRAEKE